MLALYTSIGKNIKQERNRQKISQESLADMVGMDARSIVAIETGDRNPTIKTLYKIAKALKVSSSEILPF